MAREELANSGYVTYMRDGNVGIITLNRPEKMNAVNVAVWEDLDRAVTLAREDKETRAILLNGAGRCFCAGLDLSQENDIIPLITGAADASQKMRFYGQLKRLLEIHTNLERLSKPTIAVVHGYCLGAGLELILTCDIRLCSSDAVFALPEAKLAIITDVGGLQRLPRVVGPGHAREIAFRGHRFNAERARSINLVNDVYPDKSTLDLKAFEMAREIASNPPLAVQGAKDVFLFNEEVPPARAMDYNATRSSMIMPSEDLLEAISAFLQKREGKFKGA